MGGNICDYTQRSGHWAEDKPENMYRFHNRRERERERERDHDNTQC